MSCFFIIVTIVLIACQYGDIFLFDLVLAVFGHGFQAEQPNAMNNLLRDAHKSDARESASKKYALSRPDSRNAKQNKRRRPQKESKQRNIPTREKSGDARGKLPSKLLSTIPNEVLDERRSKSEGSNFTNYFVASTTHTVKYSISKFQSVNVLNECNPLRTPSWEYENYRVHNDTKASKKLLIGLYSGFGAYSHLLTTTSHINRAYAFHWNHDIVVIQGAALRIKDVDGDCEPPPQRATFNKIALLQYALKHKDKYDQLLILDTDSIIYKLDFDITTLLPEGRMLAAQKVKKLDSHETWDINAGVTLWDLHHPRVERLAKEWLKYAKNGIKNDFHAPSDQFHLHYALKKGSYEKYVHALAKEFKYEQGTIIKHFIRKPNHKEWGKADVLVAREDQIQITIDGMCKEYKEICNALKRKVYVE